VVKKAFVALLCVITLTIVIFSFAGAKTVVRYGHMAPEDHPQHLGALAFAKYVSEKTGGEIEVEVFPFGQLGPERPMAEQVQAGTLHMTTISASVLSNIVQEAGIIELPFLYPDRETAYRVLDDPDIKARLARYCEPKGLVFIGYTENDFRDLTNSVRPVRKPQDLKGLRIRVIKSPVFIDTFRALGAATVSLPLEEVYDALRRGQIDGQESPFYTSVSMRFTEANRFVTETNHILSECPVLVNRKFWNSLSREQQNVFRGAADVQIRVNREQNARARSLAAEKARVQKVEVSVLTSQERQAFKMAVKPVYDKYRDTFGAEWCDFFLQKMENPRGRR
jgi:TRAP-type transport system periplasmic protein